MTKKLETVIRRLSALTEEEQDAIARYIERELKTRGLKREEPDAARQPYSSLAVLRTANLPGKPDASTSYEQALYGLAGLQECFVELRPDRFLAKSLEKAICL